MSGAKLSLLFNLKFSTPLPLERLVNKNVVDVVFNCVSISMCTFYNQRILLEGGREGKWVGEGENRDEHRR